MRRKWTIFKVALQVIILNFRKLHKPFLTCSKASNMSGHSFGSRNWPHTYIFTIKSTSSVQLAKTRFRPCPTVTRALKSKRCLPITLYLQISHFLLCFFFPTSSVLYRVEQKWPLLTSRRGRRGSAYGGFRLRSKRFLWKSPTCQMKCHLSAGIQHRAPRCILTCNWSPLRFSIVNNRLTHFYNHL